MAAKPRITIVGPGNLGSALAISLSQAKYRIDQIVVRVGSASRNKAERLARQVRARVANAPRARIDAGVIWFCVPDSEIAAAAQSLALIGNWKGKIALHSSGALAGDELHVLRRRGAAVASVHPLMTFVRNSRPSLVDVPFAVEGDAAAVRMARRIVHDLQGKTFSVRKQHKAAYHAWTTFASPLLTALLATTGRVAAAAGVSRQAAKVNMLPILRQTLANYAALDASAAFSGPIVRGDAGTVKQHLRVLRRVPPARGVYLALARAALAYLPSRNRRALEKLLRRR